MTQGFAPSTALAGDDTWPRYASNESQGVIEDMITAHGGMKRWKSAPSMSYRHEMINPAQQDDPWTSLEITQQGSRRCFQEWPLDEATLAFDGKKTWSKDWKRKNPPGMMARVSYYFLNLAWITQDDGVVLGEVERKHFPHDPNSKEYLTVRMHYDPETTGASEFEYFDLYIDPDTSLLAGVNYTMTYKPLMEVFGMGDRDFMGPLMKTYDEYTEVDGLVLTTRYLTHMGSQVYGIHNVTDYSLSKAFDAASVKMPAGATIDEADLKYRSPS
jgi:hypothetical protein